MKQFEMDFCIVIMKVLDNDGLTLKGDRNESTLGL